MRRHLRQPPATAPTAYTQGHHRARPWVSGLLALALTATGLTVTGLTAGPASAATIDTGAAASFVTMINEARAAAGLSPLAVSADLSADAEAHSQAMAASGRLYHTAALGSVVCCWTKVGENVGEGSTSGGVNAAFLASPPHRANILGGYAQVGVGVVRDTHGLLWITEDFRMPSGSPTVAVPPRSPAPRSSPASRSQAGTVPMRSEPVSRSATRSSPAVAAAPSSAPGSAADPFVLITAALRSLAPVASSAAASRDPIVQAQTYSTTMARIGPLTRS